MPEDAPVTMAVLLDVWFTMFSSAAAVQKVDPSK
jgi:hypothetical protein